jgi:RNA polymerase sigma-70 factor, ECF subfamily
MQPARAIRSRPNVHEVTSFEEFFETQRRALFGALCLVTGNRSEAEEIMQDAFLKLWERWDRVEGLERPDAYLFTVAMNLYRNRVRRAGVAARKALSRMPATDELAVIEDRDEVVRALRPLPPRQRAAIVLMSFMDFSSEDAAKILGIRASTVRALATQARASARQASEDRR